MPFQTHHAGKSLQGVLDWLIPAECSIRLLLAAATKLHGYSQHVRYSNITHMLSEILHNQARPDTRKSAGEFFFIAYADSSMAYVQTSNGMS